MVIFGEPKHGSPAPERTIIILTALPAECKKKFKTKNFTEFTEEKNRNA
jgi:hypothetical protein